MRKTILLLHTSPGTNFHHANRARVRANPAPSTPAGWLCVARLEEGFEVEDAPAVGDTTEAGLLAEAGLPAEAGPPALVGDVVEPVLVTGTTLGRVVSMPE